MLDFRNGSNGLGHWIPAFAGMTVMKLLICDSPARPGHLPELKLVDWDAYNTGIEFELHHRARSTAIL